MRIAVWTMRLGYALVVVALLLFLNVADLLPIDLIPWFHRLWDGEAPGHYAFIRAVPSEPSLLVEWWLLIAGIAAIAVGRVVRSKSQAK